MYVFMCGVYTPRRVIKSKNLITLYKTENLYPFINFIVFKDCLHLLLVKCIIQSVEKNLNPFLMGENTK